MPTAWTDDVRFAVAGFRRPGRPARSLAVTVLGLEPGHTADDVDRFTSALLGLGFDLVTDDWAQEEVEPAPGWVVETSSVQLRLVTPGGAVVFDGPWTAPDGWLDLGGDDVVLFAGADIDLHTPVRSLDEALDQGRLVAAVAELHRLPEPDDDG